MADRITHIFGEDPRQHRPHHRAAAALVTKLHAAGRIDGIISLGGGGGFTLALVLMASVRERLQLSDVPSLAQGTALSLMLAGILSLAFMGFAGLDKYQ